MNNYGRGLKIGIAWKSKRKLLGVDKSINLDQLKPIFELPNTVFFNLQYGETKNEIENFNKNHHIDIISLPEIDLYNDRKKRFVSKNPTFMRKNIFFLKLLSSFKCFLYKPWS